MLMAVPFGCLHLRSPSPQHEPALIVAARQGKEWLADAKPDQMVALRASVSDANRQLEDIAAGLHGGALRA
jgi:hypothetical protein